MCVALGFASIAKSWLLKQELGAPVSGWRWNIAWAAAAGVVVGVPVALFPARRCWQLIVGVPAILAAFGAVLWTKGFGPEDRELFRLNKADVRELREAEDAVERATRSRTISSSLVPEVPHAGEQHREAGLVGGGDHFVVADRSAGLDHRGRAGFDRGEQPVGEREEGVGSDR